ncbi:MAG: hydrolase [Leptospirales bacterium]|nr:hydrolase [Leptospirales bacterium]
MSYIPDLEQAEAILEKYNKEAFHLRHAKIVAGVMKWFAEIHDTERAGFWAVVGLLHDIDFEIYPAEHCVKGEELLREEGVDENIIRAAMSHGWGATPAAHEPVHIMEKILFAVDELTGLIGAVAIMRPSKSLADLELQSVKKKFKDKKFAAGCSRDIISAGAERLGWPLDELITKTILAMRSIEESILFSA